MAVWTVSRSDVTCGRCQQIVPPDQAFALFTDARLVRCVPCAMVAGVALNHAQVDAARHALEVERLAEAQTPLSPSQFLARRVPAPGRRRLTPIAELTGLPFDPKLAAANDR